MGSNYMRFDRNVVPELYSILFVTDMGTFKFKGRETIRLRIEKAVSSIALNSKEITIKSARVLQGGNAETARIKMDKKSETATFYFSKKYAGSAELEIAFEGSNNDGMYGFYRSRYEFDGKERWMLSSQFEPADARAAFPCFDQPDMKAVFEISIVVDKDMEAISNMPVKSVKDSEDGRKTVSFQPTPRMSTYLVYLGVGKFDKISGKLGKLDIGVRAVEGKGGLARLALPFAKKFIAFYEDYFGIKYPLPKVDLIAVPDFSAGAMENWGAITFREADLLADENSVSAAVRQNIAVTVAHELAHQWFGDLVTMKWWNDLWLNESFATFMSYKAVDSAFPEWNIRSQYFDEVIATAFSDDGTRATHPISVDVKTPGEINSIFDGISYEKGGTVLHMLEDFVGSSAFRKGLHGYLKAHSYSNAEGADLWNSVAKNSKPAKYSPGGFAKYWIEKPGYPIVKVSVGKDAYLLRQDRFVIHGTTPDKDKRWPLPLHFVTKSGSRPGYAFMSGEEFRLKAGQSDWIKLNLGQHYLYRVNYPDQMLDGLGYAIREGKIHGVDSWGIENDLFALVRSGRKPMAGYLDFVDKYCMDADYPLSSGVSSHLGWLFVMTYGRKGFDRVAEVSMKYHRTVLKKLGWNRRATDSNTIRMERASAISYLGMLGDNMTVSTARRLYKEQSTKGREIDSDIRSAVYTTIAWNGGKKEYDEFVEKYRSATVPDEKIRFMHAISLFKDPAIGKRALEFSMSKDVRYQDAYAIPAIESGNPACRDVLLEWTVANWKKLMDRYSGGSAHMMPRYVKNLAYICSPSDRKSFMALVSKKGNITDETRMAVKDTIERIDANIKFMDANGIS
ncbi:MAG: M1 family metallopeptidase [Candidatus Micrarchaeales archaeon]|jgi:tricorn protease interacting factor F2/3|uniref:Aminopeptidase n=1 Tax=Candidatus Micrarchaeum acidiphilum ARMAN-2 TaxID=425595 RepID=C7DG43_MICA2|nr:MAG: Peptidase M1 membrane alanine aminopeptidase [Candidatus Micrarchaeum acidiphilum ARMAN-2]MCW6161073.1 M1 family metallopeptidase [Candidatus Micrarchaeales archaeon]